MLVGEVIMAVLGEMVCQVRGGRAGGRGTRGGHEDNGGLVGSGRRDGNRYGSALGERRETKQKAES